MKILRAAHLGMCFGVRDAIALALGESKSRPVTVLGDLVHNTTVLKLLKDQGVQIKHQVADVTTPHVIITAHGASQATIGRARARGLQILEATCPLVHHAHRALAALVAEGFHPVIIGRREHVEVRGLTEDLDAYDVVLSEEDVTRLPAQPRFGIIAQTTQPIAKVESLVESIRRRHPGAEVRFVDTVCQPTKLRQIAAMELAMECDVTIVVGGAASNNTHELVETSRRHCQRVHHIQSAVDLRATWFNQGDTIGLTAGTSTPDEIIAAVEDWLRDFCEFQTELSAHVNGSEKR